MAYQLNQSSFAGSAIELQEAKTLKAANLTISGNTTANLPISTSAVAYASGGTYVGSAQATTSPSTSGVQNKGASFLVTSDGSGAVTTIKPVIVGDNVATAGGTDTIIFDAATLNDAFGVTNITGTATITLAGGDLERPSGTFNKLGASLYVGGAGNVKVIMANDEQPIVIKGIAANTYLPILVKRVYNLASDTETTATDILALF